MSDSEWQRLNAKKIKLEAILEIHKQLYDDYTSKKLDKLLSKSIVGKQLRHLQDTLTIKNAEAVKKVTLSQKPKPFTINDCSIDYYIKTIVQQQEQFYGYKKQQTFDDADQYQSYEPVK